jgi:hypothetical protein
MLELICPKCSSKEYYTELKANNNVARCSACDTFIKNIPYDQPKFFVGKYKNQNIGDLDDLGYLKWAHKEMNNLNERTKKAIQERISQLEFLAK